MRVSKLLAFCSVAFTLHGCVTTPVVPTAKEIEASTTHFESCEYVGDRFNECDVGCRPDSGNLFCHLTGHGSRHFKNRLECKQAVVEGLRRQKAHLNACVEKASAEKKQLSVKIKRLQADVDRLQRETNQARADYERTLKDIKATERDIQRAEQEYLAKKNARNTSQVDLAEQQQIEQELLGLETELCLEDPSCNFDTLAGDIQSGKL